MTNVDRDRKRRAERRVVERDHRIEMQAPRLLGRERRTDDAGRMPNDECHLFGRAKARRNEKVALVFAIVIVGDNDDLAPSKGRDSGLDP